MVEIFPFCDLLTSTRDLERLTQKNFKKKKNFSEGICGSCAMNIDGTNGLACLTKVDRDEKNASTATRVAPLPHLVRERELFFSFRYQNSLFLSFSDSRLSFSDTTTTTKNIYSSSSRTSWST